MVIYTVKWLYTLSRCKEAKITYSYCLVSKVGKDEIYTGSRWYRGKD